MLRVWHAGQRLGVKLECAARLAYFSTFPEK